MDHTTHAPLNATELNDANLLDAVIYGLDDERIGSVSQVHGTGILTSVIVDVGGFLGLGAKTVAMKASDLHFMRDENGNVHASTAWTKEQVKGLPEYQY